MDKEPKRSTRARTIGMVAMLAFGTPAVAVELPPGFVQTTIINGNVVPGAVTFDFAPDGTLWVAQTTGKVYVYSEGSLTEVHDTYGPTFPGTGERGFHTLALDPDFATNAHVWMYFTHFPESGPVVNRLSRYTSVDGSLQDETVMLEGPPVESSIHNGGCLAFASDKTLFLGIGDDSQQADTAQDTFDLRGSIIHINRDGTPVAGNPYFDGSEGEPRIWAKGFRNPFRCSIQPETDSLFVSDVGALSWEEISIAVPGGNFGWPSVEGPAPPAVPGMTYPLYAYSHDGSGAAVVSGAHVPPGEFHPDYTGDFFFGDWWREEIYRMVLDGDTELGYVETWGTAMGKVVDFKFGPDGALYYVARQLPTTSVGRIEYVGGVNRQPNAVGQAIPDSGPSPLSVALDGSGSSDPDEDPLTYDWDFGDGGSSTDAVAANEYDEGVFEATLTVDDGNGLSATSQPIRIVSGNQRPTATIQSPADASAYDAGQVISYSGIGSDAEEGSVPCSQFTWRVIFHHDVHTHPFLGPLQGDCGGTFTPATRGEAAADTWYEVKLEVRDTGEPIGSEAVLSGESSVEVFPNTSLMTFETAPQPDLTLELDTVPFTSPMSAEGVVGFIRLIGAQDEQHHPNGHTYRWQSWSDAGAIEHEIATPADDTTYTATFVCDVIVEAEQLVLTKKPGGTLALSWDPVSDPCLAPGPERYRIYTASSSIPATPPGSFPLDPEWAVAGTTAVETFELAAGPSDTFILVVPVGTNGDDGAVGHYGF